jgi:zinc protease
MHCRMRFCQCLSCLVATFLLAAASVASEQTTEKAFAPEDLLPLDQEVTLKQLDNGLTYYVRANHKPEKRAYIALAVNAGSVLEDDDQQGLAHLVEHMAFNGTAKYAKNQLVDYLESIGMRFGPEINAYTGFDETVYHLEVPTDSAGILERGVEILAEWAHNLTFDDEEIDKERLVVIEEWRQGRGAAARMTDKELPVLLKDSRYAERLPIGKIEILETFDHDALRRFYKDWYRPDLMAVVAVGDFDTAQMEALIQRYFAPIPAPANPRPRPDFPVPVQDQTLFSIVTDKEATQTSVDISQKLAVEPRRTVADYARTLTGQLHHRMLSARLQELLEQPDPPFVNAYSYRARFVRTRDFYLLGADVKEDGITRGLQAILLEARRVALFGFTQSELDRQKDQVLRQMEVAYNERDKTESSALARRCTTHFLRQEPMPGIEYSYELAQELLPTITLDEVNALTAQWTPEAGRVVTVEAPDKDGLVIPDEAAIRTLIDAASGTEITAYDDKVSQDPLVPSPPVATPVVRESTVPDLGVTEWTLDNGARVILKPTDFKNDEVLFWGLSPGGTSLAPDDDFVPAWFAAALVGQSGVGSFDAVALTKRLTGKVVNVSPYIDEMTEGLRGSASPADLETLFQLVYEYFTSSRLDSTSFLSYKSRMEAWLENKDADPGNAFSDTIQVTMSRHHPRRPILTTEVLGKMDPVKAHTFYRERFADASDFTFFLVGALEPESVRPLVETYLGGLPALHRVETWKDLGIDPPTGVIKKEIRKGIEPKSRVSLTFAGPFEWSLDNAYDLGALASALRIKLREVIREDEGGTYNVSVGASSTKYPDQEYSVSIGFGCDPERVDELVDLIFTQVDSVRAVPLDQVYIDKVKEAQRREWEINLKQNGFWLRNLRYYYFYDIPREEIMRYPDRLEALTAEALREIAGRYLSRDAFVEVVLYPQSNAESN